MKTKLLKKVRKHYKIVERTDYFDDLGEYWGNFFTIEKDGHEVGALSQFERVYYEISVWKNSKDLTREEAFEEVHKRFIKYLRLQYGKKAPKKKVSPKKIIWPKA